MATRGKKSIASLAVLPSAVLDARPEPSKHLTKQEAIEWKLIVDRMPANFFTAEMLPMLSALCQHIVAARRLSTLLENLGEAGFSDLDEVDRLDKILKMRERENKAIASFSTKLRLTPQSRYQPSTAAAKVSNATTSAKPWDFGKTA
jgi:hypothetical protein